MLLHGFRWIVLLLCMDGVVLAYQEAPSSLRKQAKEALDKSIADGEILASDALLFQQLIAASPADRTRLLVPSQVDAALDQQEQKVRRIMERWLGALADERFAMAQDSLQSGKNADAFRLCFETLALSPKHSEASKLLAPWIKSFAQPPVPSKSDKSFASLDWKPGSYNILKTPHFTIASRASSKVASNLAEHCEQTYCIWQQLFFDVWCGDRQGANPFLSQAMLAPATVPFRVVLCRNQEEYVKLLTTIEPNIRISTGYYSPKLRMAFFYWDERDPSRSITTLRHELTHLLFSEASREAVHLDADQQPGIWIVEGIALYFESLTKIHHGSFDLFEVGGWDAPRLQASRFRRLHQEEWVPWDDLHAETGMRLRNRSDIQLWYTQAAGLAHYLMDGDTAKKRYLLDYLQSVYRGSPTSSPFDGSKSDNELRANYDRFLQSPFGLVAQRQPNPDRLEIVATHFKIGSKDLLHWPLQGRKLKRLDLAFTQVDDALFLDQKDQPWEMERLGLEKTKITDASLPSIAKIAKLEELDLSQCDVSDAGVAALRGNNKLKYLWLTGTKITDQSYETLRTLRSLEQLELTGTNVSQETIRKLKKALPKWKAP